LAQAQKNVEDLLAQNALLLAAQTPPPFNHDAVEGTNPDGNPEGSGEKAGPQNEDQEVPVNPVPPTDSERRLQKMIQDLGAKYDALSKTIDQKRDGNESLVDNLFRHGESIFTEEVSNFDLPGRFKVPDIPIFSGSEDPVEHLDNSDPMSPCTRHQMLWHAELFLSPCQERPETGSGIFNRGRLIVSTPLGGNS